MALSTRRRALVIVAVAVAAALLVPLLRPAWVVRALARRAPDVLYFVDTAHPVVALTIDDGPDSASTPLILDVLARHQARATFFLIADRVRGHEPLLGRMRAEGHELGNHLTRDEPSVRLSAAEFERELMAAHRVLAAHAEPRWFRPGAGWFSEGMLATLRRHRYACALGSVYPFDAAIPWSWFASRYVLGHVEPGSIIVLHDAGARGRRTAATLRAVLPELRARGFAVVTLSRLVQLSTARTPRPDSSTATAPRVPPRRSPSGRSRARGRWRGGAASCRSSA